MNYTDEKLADVYRNHREAQRGTELHEFAAEAIRLGIKLRANGTTLSSYVNDAIGYRMTPEQVLFYSANAFGTADAISFRKNVLRVHDLKTGKTRTSEHQLEVYNAFFCLEYGFKPSEIEIENRIYQNDEVQVFHPDPDFLTHLMDRIITFDSYIDRIRMEALA